MKKLIFMTMTLIAASFLLISCGAPAANNAGNKPANNAATNTATSTASSEADVKKTLADLQAALGKNDVAALEKIYSDDYTFVSAEGEVQTKAERLAGMKSGDLKIESISFDDTKIRMYGDSAVVTAKTTVKSTTKGKDTSGTSTASIVFAKTKDGWRVVHGHPSSPMAAAKTDDKKADDDKKGEDDKKEPAPAANANR